MENKYWWKSLKLLKIRRVTQLEHSKKATKYFNDNFCNNNETLLIVKYSKEKYHFSNLLEKKMFLK